MAQLVPHADDGYWLDVDADGVDLLSLLLPGSASQPDCPLALPEPAALVDDDLLRELEGELLPGGTGAQPQEAPPAPLRCLDGGHAPGCSRCRAAPREGEEGKYQLRTLDDDDTASGDGAGAAGGAGGGDSNVAVGSGIKRLRALLLLSKEWNSVYGREDAARAEEARGDPTRVAPLLRAKQSKALCKAHLLLLCRRWGYASDLWHRPLDVSRKRSRVVSPKAAAAKTSAAATAAAAAAALPVPRQLASVELLAGPVGGDSSSLRVLWMPSAACFLGDACRVECARAGVAFYNASIDAEFEQFASGSRAAAAQIATLACAQVRWNTAVRGRLAADAAARGLPLSATAGERIPALLVNSYATNGVVPAESAMLSFIAANGAFHAAWRARRTSAEQVLSAVAPSLRLQPIDDEAEALYAYCARFMSEALLLLTYVKARGSAADYLTTCVSVLDEVARFVSSIQDNMASQRAWYRERLASGKLRPLEHDVTRHRFEEIWLGVVENCEQTLSSAAHGASELDNGSAAPPVARPPLRLVDAADIGGCE
jgi:hypothetical protein